MSKIRFCLRHESAALAAALLTLACLPAFLAPRAEAAAPKRTHITDSFDSPRLNTTVWSPFFLGIARLPLASEDAACGAPINGRGAFILQGGGSFRQLQPLLLPPDAAASVQAMRVCNNYSSPQLVLEYSDDEEASWQEAWIATDLPYGVLKPYEWTMPPATANKTVLLRFRIPSDSALSSSAAVALDDLVSEPVVQRTPLLIVRLKCWIGASATACYPCLAMCHVVCLSVIGDVPSEELRM